MRSRWGDSFGRHLDVEPYNATGHSHYILTWELSLWMQVLAMGAYVTRNSGVRKHVCPNQLLLTMQQKQPKQFKTLTSQHMCSAISKSQSGQEQVRSVGFDLVKGGRG